MMKSIINIRGAWAELFGAPVSVLERTLSFLSPDCKHSQAYRDGRWDGMIRLFKDRAFPAGLLNRVADAVREDGYDLQILGQKEKPLDLSRLTDKYLPGITLWRHQYDAILAMLTNPRCSVKIQTRGGKTEVMAAVARYLWEERGWRTLILVPRKGLLDQTWKRCKKYYGSDLTVGRIGDGHRSFGVVTVATAQTLIGFQPRKFKGRIIPADEELKKFVLNGFQVLALDECHHSKSRTWQEIAMASNAVRRYGMSGTPLTTQELADAMMIGASGPVVYEAVADALVGAGLLNRPKIAVILSDSASGGPLPYLWGTYRNSHTGQEFPCKQQLSYADAYQQGVADVTYSHAFQHNQTVMKCAEWMVDHGRSTLILCRQRKHFATLMQWLKKAGIAHKGIYGDHDVPERTVAKRALEAGKIKVLLASSILDEGEDLPGLGAIVLAENVSSGVNAVQRIGRGMQKTKAGDVWVTLVAPCSHPTLLKHALMCVRAWEQEGYEVRVVENWKPDGDYDSMLPFLTWDSGKQHLLFEGAA